MHELCTKPSVDKNCCCQGKGFEYGSYPAIEVKRPVGRPPIIKEPKELEPVSLIKPERLQRTNADAALRRKPGETMRDVLSTGRHRAAIKIPGELIKPGDQQIRCQWEGLRYAGGGIYPIVGCAGNPATDRHHGPDKSVLNNDDNFSTIGHNLHAICSWCHNRWHTLNDPTYDEPRPEGGVSWLPTGKWIPHDPDTKAESAEINQYNAWWQLPVASRQLVNGGIFKYERPKQSKDNLLGTDSSNGDVIQGKDGAA